MARARGNEHKLEHRRFPVNVRNHICAVMKDEGALAQVAQRLWGHPFGDLQKLHG